MSEKKGVMNIPISGGSGLYKKMLTESERALYAVTQIGRLDDEIRLVRVLLNTALELRAKMEAHVESGGREEEGPGYSLIEVREKEEEGIPAERVFIRKKVDIDAKIDLYLNRLARLEAEHMALASHGGEDPRQFASKLLEVMQEIRQSDNVADA